VGYTISGPFTQSRGKRLHSALGAQGSSRYQTGAKQDSARSYEPLLFKGNDFSKTETIGRATYIVRLAINYQNNYISSDR